MCPKWLRALPARLRYPRITSPLGSGNQNGYVRFLRASSGRNVDVFWRVSVA